jgi:hypothetical protein
MERRSWLPKMVDSGGFGPLFTNAQIRGVGGLGVIEIERNGEVERITTPQVLEFQEHVANDDVRRGEVDPHRQQGRGHHHP